MDTPVPLRAVDSVDVTILVDNSIDMFLRSDSHVARPPMAPDWFERPHLRAEHGYSALVTLRANGAETRLVYDAGISSDTFSHNLSALELSLRDVNALVLSHGHGDHHGGLEGLLRAVGRKRLPLILHPDAWKTRKIVFPTGAEARLPPPDRALLAREDVEILEREGPSYLFGDTALVSGRVERVTEFEKGFPVQWAQGASGWEPDPMVWDDQCLICHVKGHGLVVVSGCGHAGAVNILRHARRVTGVDRVHAFVGGLHLTGASFEPIIPPTIAELEKIGPEVIVPGHCTGWKARQELARRMPRAYYESSVGSRFHFGSPSNP
jgi:7,8-dihydropterin-6-yl-methyl-4-(beta-D-ribofuranosyl)aminobenzene 5'-phosphate synthase